MLKYNQLCNKKILCQDIESYFKIQMLIIWVSNVFFTKLKCLDGSYPFLGTLYIFHDKWSIALTIILKVMNMNINQTRRNTLYKWFVDHMILWEIILMLFSFSFFSLLKHIDAIYSLSKMSRLDNKLLQRK